MRRRDFLRNGLAIGTTALFSGIGLAATGGPPASSAEPVVVVEPLPPIWDAAIAGRWNIVKEWLQHDPSLIGITGDATLHDVEYKKVTLLHLAVILNFDVMFLDYLIAQGGDVNAVAKGWETPLCFAAGFNSNVEVLKYLVSVGAKGHRSSMPPLYWAAWRNSNVAVLEYLVSQGAKAELECDDYQNYNGWTPLHSAGCNPNVEIHEYLISQGMVVNAKEVFGHTPLHMAALCNPNMEVVKFLISAGANVLAKNDWDETPLDCADTEEKRNVLREAMSNQKIDLILLTWIDSFQQRSITKQSLESALEELSRFDIHNIQKRFQCLAPLLKPETLPDTLEIMTAMVTNNMPDLRLFLLTYLGMMKYTLTETTSQYLAELQKI